MDGQRHTAGVTPPTTPGPELRYVALGDSYTIGTSVAPEHRFPEQLAVAWPSLDLVANLGVNGFTTADLIRAELPALGVLAPDVVTLLIGVNDVVQGVPMGRYQANLTTILDDLTARLPPERIVTITVPDYTVTPAGADYGDPTARSAAIRECNRIMERLADARGIACVDVHDISLDTAADRTLVADDGLHPSGAQYARWVARLVPVVARLLEVRS
ncbi:SGNH/GDSL hydrolase family protein [soil metagenome]